MNASIENDQLKVIVSTKGAELQSIKSQTTNLEYLWQGDATYWERRSPILFPIVGKLKGDAYILGDKKYSLRQHGFARNMEFELLERSAHCLIYHLKASDESKESYPFDFELSVTYFLQETRLTTRYSVENPADKSLFFSIGAHPAFNCPLREGEKQSDYSLMFEEKETLERQLISNGLRTGDRALTLKDEKELPIADDLFDQDALIFDEIKSNQVAICKDLSPILTVIFDEFEYLGIWSKSKASPFVCIEPWLGIADHVLHSGELTQKEGIIELKPKEVFTAQYHIVFSRD